MCGHLKWYKFCFVFHWNKIAVNSCWTVCGCCWVSIPLPRDSLTVTNKCKMSKKPQFEYVAHVQYPSQVKNCMVHMQQLSLCVKCCNICDFIRRHFATVKLVLNMPPQWTLTLKGTSHCMTPRQHFQARSGQMTWSLPLSHMETESMLPCHKKGPGEMQVWMPQEDDTP